MLVVLAGPVLFGSALAACVNGKLTPAAGDAIVSGAEAVNAAGCGFLVPLALSAVGLPASAESLVCAGEEQLVARALKAAIAKVTASPSDGGADHVASAAAAMSTPAKVPLRYRGRLVGFVPPGLAGQAQAFCDSTGAL